MCPDLFSEKAPCGSILVNDHLPRATTQSLHFGWSLTVGSTVVNVEWLKMAGTSTRGLVSYRGVRLMEMSVKRDLTVVSCVMHQSIWHFNIPLLMPGEWGIWPLPGWGGKCIKLEVLCLTSLDNLGLTTWFDSCNIPHSEMDEFFRKRNGCLNKWLVQLGL